MRYREYKQKVQRGEEIMGRREGEDLVKRNGGGGVEKEVCVCVGVNGESVIYEKRHCKSRWNNNSRGKDV